MSPELLYQLAMDFIYISASEKFRIGREMHILETFDVLSMTELEAERIVFSEAYKRGKIETLIYKMYGNQYER
jgi:hypothetical protein